MSKAISIHDVARGSLTNGEFAGINADLKQLDERIGRLLREGHGPACSCPACLAAGQVAIGEFVADLTALRWLLKRRVFFSPAWLLSDAEARQRWEERQVERRAEKAGAGEGGDGHPSLAPSPRVDQPASRDVPSIEVGADPKSPRRKKVA